MQPALPGRNIGIQRSNRPGIAVAAWLFALALTHPPQATAQSSPQRPHITEPAPPAALPEFEVASVRPSGPHQIEINGLYTYPGGEVRGNGCRVQYLIMAAFDVQQFQIAGGPAWIDLGSGDPFDLDAKPPRSSPAAHATPASPKSPPTEEQRQMLQSLLADRFQLRVHRAVTEGPVFFLRRSTGQLRLTPPKDRNAYPWAGGISGGWFGGGMRGENISMPQLAARLSRFLSRPVLDQTGLEGSFDFDYPIGGDGDDNDADIPGFLHLAMKGIGLTLQPGKGPVETIVIDRVERPSPD